MNETWPRALIVAAGGAVGCALRYSIAAYLTSRFGSAYPWGTTAVNLLGALVFGVVWSVTETSSAATAIRLFVLTGMMGGLTTFSTLAFEITEALMSRRAPVALLHTCVHAVVGVLAMWSGLNLGRLLTRVTPGM